ncbi:MAG: WGR domain-containing protein [Deltaproteobacteria bacterium]|nr:WGR domain-containing protein [Deltaproteobacteria bacterium]
MSEWTVHLEFEEGTSSKFWRARVEGKTLYVNYGKIGSNGQTQVKQLGDPDAAQTEYDKLVREKRKKGYADAGGGGGGGEGEEEEEGEGDEEDEEEAPRKPAPKAAAAPAAAAPRSGGTRLVLEAGNRKVETTLYLDGKTVRMEAVETYASPEAAKKAHERLKKTLAGEGYNPG